MNRLFLLFAVIVSTAVISFSVTLNQSYRMTRADYIELKIGNYLSGFKQYDTSVYVFDDKVNIAIYYNEKDQGKDLALSFRDRLEYQVDMILNKHEWSRNVGIIINVYSVSGRI